MLNVLHENDGTFYNSGKSQGWSFSLIFQPVITIAVNFFRRLYEEHELLIRRGSKAPSGFDVISSPQRTLRGAE
jgi:hypothetical protein